MILSILIPAFNEEATIQKVLQEIRAIDLSSYGISKKEVILIDDGSTDKTVEKAVNFNTDIIVVRHTKNQGKGASLSSALPRASGDIILIQDADLEYSPSLYPVLLKLMTEQKADIVYGSRFLEVSHPKNMRLSYFLANRFGNFLVNLLYKTRLTDTMTCFKLFRKHTLTGITLSTKGFGIDTELTAKVIKSGFKIKEVPIPYKARTFKEGKKFRPIYSLHVLWAIIKYAF